MDHKERFSIQSIKTKKKVSFRGNVIPTYGRDDFGLIIELKNLSHSARCQIPIILKEELMTLTSVDSYGETHVWVSKVVRFLGAVNIDNLPLLVCDCIWLDNLSACEAIDNVHKETVE